MKFWQHIVAWSAVLIVVGGIYFIFTISLNDSPDLLISSIVASNRSTNTPTATATTISEATPTAQFMPTSTAVQVATADESPIPADESESITVALLPTPTPQTRKAIATEKPKVTPVLSPLVLPEVPLPDGGVEYQFVPLQASEVGWAQDLVEDGNHFGDYNIYAGMFDGRERIGAIRFDISEIPAGSPIIHADLSLTGLADTWLGTSGEWSVELLEPWMDETWADHNYHWLSRDDSVISALIFPLSPSSLGYGRLNTFFFTAEHLSNLQDRLFDGSASFRVKGPSEGNDNLFSWDSGFGGGSLGRRPVLRIVTGPPPADSPPTPTPNIVIVTPVPDDDRILAIAAERLTATSQAQTAPGAATPTPIPSNTPFPPNWVTPFVVENTAVPDNAATAQWVAQIATAQAVVHGTPTTLPRNAWTATPLPPSPTLTPTPDLVAFTTLTPTATPTVTPDEFPPVLRNKILFKSDRYGEDTETLMVMNPDGSEVAIWAAGANDWIFQEAQSGHAYSANSQYKVVVGEDSNTRDFQIFIEDLFYDSRKPLHYMEGISYDPVFSPTEYKIAFVSLASGNDEIYTANVDSTGLARLTNNDWEWDKHPTWSPDGSQIAFWSNRDTARRQIWLMNADGSGQRNISNNSFNDWDPVWVR